MIARSYLYVPADNAEKLDKAVNRGSDALIIDFEDSVSIENKDIARQNFAEWLEKYSGDLQIWVRLNSDFLDKDLEFVISEKVYGVIVPKASVENTSYVAGKIPANMKISALIETADSILNALNIAKVNKVAFLQIGQLDLRAELGLTADLKSNTLQYALSHLVLASAAAGIEQPIAPMFRDFNDAQGLRSSCEQFKADGFFGSSCIHPKQIEVINDVFSTSESELREAREVIDSLEPGKSVGIDRNGRMIDEASLKIAQRILRRSGQV